MTSSTMEPVTELLREALGRLARQEQRTEAIEEVLLRLAPATVFMNEAPRRKEQPIEETPSVASFATPIGIPHPIRREPSPISVPPVSVPSATSSHAPVASQGSNAVSPLAVLASLDDVVWSISPDGQLVFMLAGAVERTYGRPASDFLASPRLWIDSVPGDDRAELLAAFRRLPSTDSFTLEHRIETVAGVTRWVVSRGRLIRNREGRAVRIDGTSTDVSTRARRDRAGLEIFTAIGPAIGPDFIARAVQHLAVGFESRAAVVAVPDSADPLLARTTAVWLDGRLAEPFTFSARGAFTRDLLAGGSRYIPALARDRFPTDEFLAQLRAESAVAEPLIDSKGALLGFVAIADDRPIRPDAPDARSVLRALAPRIASELARSMIQDHRAAELEARLAEAERRATEAEARANQATEAIRTASERVRQSRQLETVGRLVAGVAHDFNNFLTVIAGNAEVVRELLPPNDPLRDPTNLIMTTAHSAAVVARQLVAVGKPITPEPVAVDLNVTVRKLEHLLRQIVGNGVTLAFTLSTTMPRIHIDPGQLSQVLLNLVINARDAIADTGTITVRTAEVQIEAGRSDWPADRPPGKYVALTITDTGCGMSDDVKTRAFDPFFTTKGDRGSGIGLATIDEIAKGSNGHIQVESSLEWGTTVRLFWPRHDEVMAEEPIASPSPTPQISQGETVLLVQDGNPLRDIAAIALQHAGYRVLEAADRETGEERARFFVGPIQLLVTDLGLPNGGGIELAERIQAARPGIKVLFLSGSHHGERPPGAFLAKPYSPYELLDAVRRALDS